MQRFVSYKKLSFLFSFLLLRQLEIFLRKIGQCSNVSILCYERDVPLGVGMPAAQKQGIILYLVSDDFILIHKIIKMLHKWNILYQFCLYNTFLSFCDNFPKKHKTCYEKCVFKRP